MYICADTERDVIPTANFTRRSKVNVFSTFSTFNVSALFSRRRLFVTTFIFVKNITDSHCNVLICKHAFSSIDSVSDGSET